MAQLAMQASAGSPCQRTSRVPELPPPCGSASRQRPHKRQRCHRSWQIPARKASTASEWDALAAAYADPDDVSGELAGRINQVCNAGLRHMLRGDRLRVERFKDELSELGNQFGRQGHKDGATFVYVLYKIAEHELPPEHENLQGPWRSSFLKLWECLEDSGWKVKLEGEEDDEEDGDGADGLGLPDVGGGYFQLSK